MNIAFTQDQLLLIILAVIFLIALIIVVIAWIKTSSSRNSVALLEKQAELKKIELVERDLENKRRKEDLANLSVEDQEKLKQIRLNTSEVMAQVGLLNTEVSVKVEQLEAKTELLKLKKLSEELDKKEKELVKSLEK